MKPAYLFLSVLLLSPVTSALAQASAPAGSESAPAAPDKPQPRSGKTVYDFEAADIMGQLKRPEGAPIVEPPEFHFRRLLNLDESFIPNIVRSVDEF